MFQMRQPTVEKRVNVLCMWILGGIIVAGAIAAFVRLRGHDDGLDLGTVSAQWLVEYRQSQES